jgi:hypothetical protein
MASKINWVGVVAGYVGGGFLLAWGLTIATNWRGYGLRHFNFGVGLWWWRRQDFTVFRALLGGGYVFVGSLVLIADTVGLLNRLN